MRSLIRPTGFVDSPFGHDGKVARLAGGLCWFGLVELLRVEGPRRVASEIVPVEAIDRHLEADDDLAQQWQRLTAPRAALELGERIVRLDQPQLMGIVNATPDSFSDGGAHGDATAAADAGFAMARAGAAIVDVGGESTRPGAAEVWEGDEIGRVEPVVRQLAAGGVAVSIDTRKSGVMGAALGAGARLVNDVSGLGWDPLSAGVVAAARVPVVLMHHQGSPRDMQDAPHYADVAVEVYQWLEARIETALAAGIARANILVDPGIGFGKTLAHNLELMNHLSLLHGLGCAIVLGASRKRLIGALDREAGVDERLAGSVALALAGAAQGVQLFRVHDVVETMQALRVWRGLRDQALTPRLG